MISLGVASVISAAALMYIGSMKWLKAIDLHIESTKIKEGTSVRVLHISDLHGNSSHKQNLNIWKKINSTGFDFAVITGDLILDYLDELNPHLDMLRTLAKKTKVYYVDGNHEKYIYTDIKKKLEEAGITVLCNERTTVNINGNALDIIGVRDWYWLKKNKTDIRSIFDYNKSSKDRFTLLLSHQPQIFDFLGNCEPDLVLCGHTHGGQVRLPGIPTLYAPGQGFLPKYSHGLYKTGKSQMFISKGIGATNFPVRFYNRPEIVVVTLTN